MRRYVFAACGVEHPYSLTSGKLRKHIATISTISSLNEDQQRELYGVLGHTEFTNQNFYQIPQDIFQVAILTRFLHKASGKKIDNPAAINLDEELEEVGYSDNDSAGIIENVSSNVGVSGPSAEMNDIVSIPNSNSCLNDSSQSSSSMSIVKSAAPL